MKHHINENGIYVGANAMQALIHSLTGLRNLSDPQTGPARMLANCLMILVSDADLELAIVRLSEGIKPEIHLIDHPEGVGSDQALEFCQVRDEIARRIKAGGGVYVEMLYSGINDEALSFQYPESLDANEVWT